MTDSGRTRLLVWTNHDPDLDPPDLNVDAYGFSSFNLNGVGGNDTLTLDFSNGNPLFFHGLGLDSAGGTLTLTSTGIGSDSMQMAGVLTIVDGSRVTLAPSHKLLIVLSLNMTSAATLDLSDGALIVQSDAAKASSVLSNLTALITTGRNQGTWDGQGIRSSTAAADTTHLSGLGILLNSDGDGQPIHSAWEGVSVSSNDVLVKYTSSGDLDLNGSVDADDYFRIDSGFAEQLSGYANGDLDYSSTIDVNDYALIDAAFANQSVASASPAAVLWQASVIPPTEQTRRSRKLHHRLRD